MVLKDKQKKTIVLPMDETIYHVFMENTAKGHEVILSFYRLYPDLFPQSMEKGYVFNGKTRKSKKEAGFQMRKIRIAGQNYQIRPSFMLPYCKAKVSEVSKGLFLLKFGVPFWALAYVFDHNAMWWYRLFISLGTNELVGTTIYQSSDLSQNLLADEHHIRIKGKKHYVATTVGSNCFLGMEVCQSASEECLTQAYDVFKEEALSLKAD